MDLQTTFMGVALKNPIIVGASNLVTDLGMAKKLEDAGAAAIVYKSLFEEQLQLEAAELDDDLHMYDERNAEMTSLFPQIVHSGPKAHLMAVRKLKETLSIPVFASLNCVEEESWVEFAVYLAETGVDGLELNFYNTVTDVDKPGTDIEKMRIGALSKVKQAVKIPVAVKLSSFYTNPLHTVKQMDAESVDGFVLFNKLFQPDIDIHNHQMKQPYNLSYKGENRLPLRYAGLLAGNIKADICSNTGIMDGEDVVAMLLAGANVVQVVSTIYKNGAIQITRMLDTLVDYMKKNGYKSIDEFRGNMLRSKIREPYAYTRAQYVDFLMHSKKFTDDFPV
ncbi:MAG: dihydroorotate dehydrogenase-like protein [Breznakibacter sp.]